MNFIIWIIDIPLLKELNILDFLSNFSNINADELKTYYEKENKGLLIKILFTFKPIIFSHQNRFFLSKFGTLFVVECHLKMSKNKKIRFYLEVLLINKILCLFITFHKWKLNHRINWKSVLFNCSWLAIVFCFHKTFPINNFQKSKTGVQKFKNLNPLSNWQSLKFLVVSAALHYQKKEQMLWKIRKFVN